MKNCVIYVEEYNGTKRKKIKIRGKTIANISIYMFKEGQYTN